jgi:hypothetical protein
VNPAKHVAPIHFEDFSGVQFERLVFAYLVRTEPRFNFEWYGQAGTDGGRDIVGVGNDVDNADKTIIVACANWDALTSTKAITDFDKIVASGHGKPDEFRVVTRSAVSSAVRDTIKDHCHAAGVFDITIWGGVEFEEHLRHGSQSLVKRFVEGEVFPDTIEELIAFSRAQPPGDDAEIVSQYRKLFDRPAFVDRIAQESSLPAFKQAIEDTICALNTGIWKSRDGTEIARICSLHQLRDEDIKEGMRSVVLALMSLRTDFDDGLRSGSIKPCGCGKPDCPVFSMDYATADHLEAKRDHVLSTFHQVLANVTS